MLPYAQHGLLRRGLRGSYLAASSWIVPAAVLTCDAARRFPESRKPLRYQGFPLFQQSLYELLQLVPAVILQDQAALLFAAVQAHPGAQLLGQLLLDAGDLGALRLLPLSSALLSGGRALRSRVALDLSYGPALADRLLGGF